MKKKTSISLLVLSILIFLGLNNYSDSINYNYHIDALIGYLFFWIFVLFIFSLFAFILNDKKYKIWLIIGIIISILSILIAYGVGDGNGAIVDIDGELITWFFAGLYSFISIIYFIVQFFKNRNKPL